MAIPNDERFVFFDSAESCADAAAPIFEAQRWRWTSIGIPNRDLILTTLKYLEGLAARHSESKQHTETGRLIYYRGRYGHERPKGKVRP